MRTPDICKKLKISRTTLFKLEKKGLIKAYKFSERLKFYDFNSLVVKP